MVMAWDLLFSRYLNYKKLFCDKSYRIKGPLCDIVNKNGRNMRDMHIIEASRYCCDVVTECHRVSRRVCRYTSRVLLSIGPGVVQSPDRPGMRFET